MVPHRVRTSVTGEPRLICPCRALTSKLDDRKAKSALPPGLPVVDDMPRPLAVLANDNYPCNPIKNV